MGRLRSSFQELRVQSNWEYVNDFLTDACLFCDGHKKSAEEIASTERGDEEHSEEGIRLLIKESAIPKDALSSLVSESDDSSILCWFNSSGEYVENIFSISGFQLNEEYESSRCSRYFMCT